MLWRDAARLEAGQNAEAIRDCTAALRRDRREACGARGARVFSDVRKNMRLMVAQNLEHAPACAYPARETARSLSTRHYL